MNAGGHLSRYSDVRRDTVAVNNRMTTVRLSSVSLEVKMRHVELRYFRSVKAVGLLIQLGTTKRCAWTVNCLYRRHPGGSQVLHKEPLEHDKPISVNCWHSTLQ